MAAFLYNQVLQSSSIQEVIILFCCLWLVAAHTGKPFVYGITDKGRYFAFYKIPHHVNCLGGLLCVKPCFFLELLNEFLHIKLLSVSPV